MPRANTLAVLKQYRTLLRLASALDKTRVDGLGKDAARQIKAEFRAYQRELDKATVAVLLKQGERHVETLRALLGLPATKPEAGQGWRGITDEDGADERGRVGEGWPWQTRKD